MIEQFDGVHLTGLEGTNPLGYLAALGVQVAFASETTQPRLWWTDDVTPHAVVDAGFDTERIATRVMDVLAQWWSSKAMNPVRADGTPMPKGDELKLQPRDLREYLSQHRMRRSHGALATALLAEDSLDNNGAAKPSDLYFTAGRMIFLKEARKLLKYVTINDIVQGLTGPWLYDSELPSMRWDVSDDPAYALRAVDPSKDKKPTNPGPEVLAILGISRYPVFSGRGRTKTQGCSGTWKNGSFSWPLWARPMSFRAVRSVLAQVGGPSLSDEGGNELRHRLRACSVVQIMTSAIARSDQGGFGLFRPPRLTKIALD